MRNIKEYPITETEVMKVIMELQVVHLEATHHPVGDLTPYIISTFCDFLAEHITELVKRMEIKVE